MLLLAVSPRAMGARSRMDSGMRMGGPFTLVARCNAVRTGGLPGASCEPRARPGEDRRRARWGRRGPDGDPAAWAAAATVTLAGPASDVRAAALGTGPVGRA